MAFCGI